MVDVEQIINILNIVLIVLFSLTIAGIVIAFVRGLFRGFWKSTFYLGWYGTLLAVSFLTLGPTLEAVGNVDLTDLGLFVNITAESGTFAVPVTSVKETLHQAIALSLTLNGMGGSAGDISQAAWSITVMVLKYSIFIVSIISIVILGTFFGWLLWNLIFKHFIPKIVRKRVKLRIVSALEGMATFTVLTGLFLAPFTSLVNIANQAWQRNRDEENQTETMKTIDRFMETYNDSLFAKTFFNWTVNEDGLTIDSAIINDITKTTVGDMETSIIETIDGLGQVGVAIAGAFTIDENQKTVIDMGYILSQETLANVFDGINKSQIFAYTLPLVATLALNVDQVKQYVDPNLVDLSDIDWLTEIKNVETLAIDVINSGVIDTFLGKDGEPVDPNSEKTNDIKSIVNSMLSEKAYPYFTRIFNSIDESKLLSRVIPSIMMYVCETTPEMQDMMPKTWEEMNQLRWGSELNIVYDNLFRLNRTAPDMVEVLTTMGSGDAAIEPEPKTILYVPEIRKADEPTSPEPGATPDPTPEPQPETGDSTGMIDVLIDNIDPLTTALVGEFDDEGHIANIDDKGHTIVYDENGQKIPGRHYTLMDSALFSYALPSLMDTLTSSMGEGENAFIKPETMDKATAKLNSGVVLTNYKNELAALFTAFKGIADNPDLKNIITGGGAEGLMDKVKDQKFVNKLVNLMPAFKNSEIFKLAVEPLLTEQITQQGEMLQQVGLTAQSITDHLDYQKQKAIEANDEDSYYDYFFDEMAYILKSMPNLLSVTDIMSDSGDTTAMFDNLTENSEKLALLLDTIYDSDILNPEMYRSGLEKNNFLGILQHLFGGEKPVVQGMELNFKKMLEEGYFVDNDCRKLTANGSGNHGWTNTKTVDGGFLKDVHGNPIFDGENGYIANALVSLGAKASKEYNPDSATTPMYSKGDSLVSVLTGEGVDITKIIGRLEQDFGISKVFAKVDDSTLIGKMLGTFMDSQEALVKAGIVGDGNGFSNIKDWTKEGETFAVICDSIDMAGVSLDSLDVTSNDIDINSLNIMLHSLADSQIFESRGSDGSYRYNFNAFLYDKLSSAFADPTSDPKADMLCDPYTRNGTRTYTMAMEDFDVNPSDKTSTITEEGSKDAWVAGNWMKTFGECSHDKDLLNGKLAKPENKHLFLEGDYISRVCNILNNLKTLKTNADANAKKAKDNAFDSNDMGQLMSSGYANTADLENVLQAIYKCEPVRMILYNAIDSLGDIKMDDISLEQINPDFFLKFKPYTNEVNAALEKDVLPNGNSKEISQIMSIYQKLDIIKDQIDTHGGEEFDDILNVILADKKNIILLKESLQDVLTSECFNLFGKSVKSYDFTTHTATYNDRTVFQSLINKFVLSEMILEILFRQDSPKDKALFNDYKAFLDDPSSVTNDIESLTDAELKAMEKAKGKKILNDNFFVPDLSSETYSEDIQTQSKEVSKIIEITSSLLGGYKGLDKLVSKIDDENNVTIHSVNNDIVNEKTYEQELADKGIDVSTVTYPGLKDTEGHNTMAFTRMDYKEIKGPTVLAIMNAINSSDVLYDLAPNALKYILSSQFGSGSSENDFFSQALNKANPYYLYDLAKQIGYKGEDIYKIRFYDAKNPVDKAKRGDLDMNELFNLSEIVRIYNEQLAGKDEIGNVFNGLKPEVISFAQEVLERLYDSYIFHKNIGLNTDLATLKTRTFADCSAFEYLYGQFFLKTGVSEILPEINILGPSASANEKRDLLYLRVTAKTYQDEIKSNRFDQDPDFVDLSGTVTNKNTWSKEIGVLCKLATSVSELGTENMTGFNLDISDPDTAKRMSPDAVTKMLAYLNGLDTADGSINEIVKGAYQGAGFDTFTTYDSTKKAANYNLTQADYGCPIDDESLDVKFSADDGTSEIITIRNLLNGLSTQEGGVHSGYVVLDQGGGESPINVFVDNNKETEILLDFLHDSHVYDNLITDYPGLETHEINTEALFFYNMMDKAKLLKYITGSDNNAKLLTINHIMYASKDLSGQNGKPLYDPHNEGIALDALIKVSDSFVSATFTFENLGDIRDALQGVIGSLEHTPTYETINAGTPLQKIKINVTPDSPKHERSYLSSEILASVLDSFMTEQMKPFTDFKFVKKFNSAKTYSQINKDSYKLLNMTEGNAIGEMLNVFEQINDPDPGVMANKLKTYFTDGSMDWSQFEYQDSIYYPKGDNSYIAAVIFTSKISPLVNIVIDGVVTQIDAAYDALPDYIQSTPAGEKLLANKNTCLEMKLKTNELFGNTTVNPYKIASKRFTAYGTSISKFITSIDSLVNPA